jgi:hypothetical protein
MDALISFATEKLLRLRQRNQRALSDLRNYARVPVGDFGNGVLDPSSKHYRSLARAQLVVRLQPARQLRCRLAKCIIK